MGVFPSLPPWRKLKVCLCKIQGYSNLTNTCPLWRPRLLETVLTVLLVTANPSIPSFLVGALVVLEGDHWHVLLEVWINEFNYTMVWYIYLCHISTIKSITVAVDRHTDIRLMDKTCTS